MSKLTLEHDKSAQRYEAMLGGERIGHVKYQDLGDGSLMLTHTEIASQHGSKGYGGELVAQVLEDVRGRGLLVIPQCSFVAGYIGQHPEYLELVHPNQRGELGMAER